MPHIPPSEYRFPVNRPYAPHTKKGPYLVPLLRKIMEKKISIEDPQTREKVVTCVKDAVIWRLIHNAIKGETAAIKEVLERTDGKVVQKLENEITFKKMGDVEIDGKKLEPEVGED